MARQAARGIDTGRLAQSLARPGMDPRIWISNAVVLSEAPLIDPKEGVFVDIVLMPSLLEETARVSAIYAGPGYGLYAPLQKDDEVQVFAPSGDPNEGLVVLPRLWSPSDPPPEIPSGQEFDLHLVVQEEQSLRVKTTGAGEIVLATDGDGKVRLGAEDADQDAVRGTAYLGAEDAVLGTLDALVAAVGAFIATPAVAAMNTPAASAVATALAAYTAQRKEYAASSSSFKQSKVKVA